MPRRAGSVMFVAMMVAGCAPRWNAESKTIGADEFVRLRDQPSDQLPFGVERWKPGGADRRYYYLENYQFRWGDWREYIYSVRAPKAEVDAADARATDAPIRR